MIEVSVSDEFRQQYQSVQLGCIQCKLTVDENQNDLWQQIVDESQKVKMNKKIDQISTIPAIQTSRKAYRTLGKDPARYRLSAEALLRRIVKGAQLYRVNNVVDLVNLASFTSGFSIGGYDADKINGNVNLGIGKANEEYTAIGRGELNIENLPVLRDSIGAFGSPTSDSSRTKVTCSTKHFLMVYFDFGVKNQLPDALQYATNLLQKYTGACHLHSYIV
jgi:DNA/RNA-binding domain of Phe-tRNA-synthetase-like protein